MFDTKFYENQDVREDIHHGFYVMYINFEL